ncbi:hypothetical protein [Paenibacillus rhizophilus]|uniref:DUF1292 domain-containing protein n=1 Tax=Paenibacillus rhizophilus TaxID=1850366 RepID=A0A3N9P1H1_9BACL|nr:hypothetical protein [Paenibacillus rhizophilus]RQW10033.1 hypothetical protein EH198_16495 [Paenibacillus rhizophilus]
MKYKKGETYTGYEKGWVFEFTVTDVTEDGVYYVDLEDGIGYAEEEETLDKWTEAYKDYLTS